MKKILFVLIIFMLSIVSFAQTINISTGLDQTGNCGKIQSIDVNWKIGFSVTPTATPTCNAPAYIVPNYVIGSTVYWQPTPIQSNCGCAAWINPKHSVGTDAPGYYTFERTLTVLPSPSIKTVNFDFKISYDDDLASLEIISPSGVVDNITSLVVRSTTPTVYYLSGPISKSYSCPANKIDGTWKIRTKVRYFDNLGGFLLSGCVNLIKGDCCDCTKPTNTNVNFSLTTTLGGATTATASAMGASTGLGNGWTLKEVAGGSVNPCKWVAGGIKWQSTGANISIPSGILLPGKCYVLTHYVNVCTTKWDPKQCVQYKAICFCVCENTINVQPDPKVDKQQILQKRMPNTEEDEILKEAEQLPDATGGRG